MQRRSFLGSICAAVAGLLVGKVAATEPERVRVRGKATLLYGGYRLEPVAGDWDGTIKPIEKVGPIEGVTWKPRLLNGSFNVPDGKGGILPWTERRPAVLACMCLQALGEKDYLVCMPDDLRPHVEWVNADPLKALVALAARTGREIVCDFKSDCVTYCDPRSR